MPTLPTLTISNTTIWNRLLTAFNNDPVEYKDWLKKALGEELRRRELAAIDEEAATKRSAKAVELNGLIENNST